MEKKSLLFLLFCIFNLIFTVNSLIANPSVELVNLTDDMLKNTFTFRSNWKFIPNDDLKYINGIDIDEEWYSYNGMASWQFEIAEAINYHDVGWYSLDFQLSDDTQLNEIGLNIIMSYSSIQLFLNGEKIYQSQNWNSEKLSTFGEAPPVIKFPKRLLNFNGKNTISIRSGSYSGWGGTAVMKIGYFHDIVNYHNLYNIKNIGIGVSALFIWLYFLVQFLLRRKELYNLYISLSGLSVSLFILGYYGHLLSIFNYSWAFWLLTFIGGINMYLLPILFIHSFFNLKKGIIAKIFIVIYSFFSLFVITEYLFTSQIFFFIKYLYNFFNLTYLFVVLYLIYISIKAVVKKLDFAKTIMIGISFLTIFFLLSMLSFASILTTEPLIGEGFFIMIVAFSFVLAQRFAKTHNNLEIAHSDLVMASIQIKDLNENLEKKVKQRTAIIKEKNTQITESIEYASLIQNSVQPSEEELSKLFSDYFVLWKPRDIVGGDLYWSHKDESGFLMAVIDCTGHGVPGALLTMTVSATLDHVVREMKITEPAEVLDQLNRILKNRLNQNNNSKYTDDGMEIGIIRYDSLKKNLKYAGSRIELHMIDMGVLTEYKGDRQGIGYKRSEIDLQFTSYDIPLTATAQYYMTTDGYIEQSGGEKRFGFGWSRYKTLLNAIFRLPMSQQKNEIEDCFDNFRGKIEQRDDILVLGFKIRGV